MSNLIGNNLGSIEIEYFWNSQKASQKSSSKLFDFDFINS